MDTNYPGYIDGPVVFLRKQLLHKIIRQRNAKKLIVPNLAAVRAGAAKV